MALADAKHPAYLDEPGKFHTLLLSLVERAATTRRNIALRAEAVQEMEADDGEPVVQIARVRTLRHPIPEALETHHRCSTLRLRVRRTLFPRPSVTRAPSVVE